MKATHQKNLFWKFALPALLLVLMTGCDAGPDEQELINRARQYIETRDLNAAVLELKNVLTENAGNAEARFLLGKIYLSLGDLVSAEKEMQRALGAGWDESAVQLSLAEILLGQGKFQQVLDDIPIKDVYPQTDRADLLAIRASAEAGLGDWDKATETLKAAKSLSPNSFWVLHSGIKILVNKGDVQAADESLATALQAYPTSQDMWLLKAALHEKKGELSEVKAALQKVMELEPPRQVTFWGRQARLVESRAYLEQQDYKNAQAVIDPILDTYPGDPLTNYLAALIAFRQGNYDQSQERLLTVLKVVPEHRPSHLLFGTLNYVRNDYQQAAYYLEKAVASQPGDPEAQILLGKTYLMLERYEEAESRLKQASSVAGDSPELIALLGVARLRGGDTETGLDNLETAAEKVPADVGVRSELARAYMFTGENQRAIDLLESGLQHSDEEYQTEALLILAYIRASEYDKAIDLANKLSARFPDYTFSDIAAGMASEGKNDYDTARRLYNKVLSTKPDNIEALLGHARLDVKEGKLEEAEQRYNAVLALQPDHSMALVSLAYLIEKKGDTEKAVDLLEQARKAGPGMLEPRLFLSNFHYIHGDADQALVYAEEAYSISQDDMRVLQVLGKAQLGAGDATAAVQTLQALVDQVPELPGSHYYLALAKAAAGDLEGARNSLKKTLKLNPEHNQAMLALGNLELKSGNADAALSIARQLQKATPDSAAGYLLEGDVMMAGDNAEKALAAYQLALTRTRSNEVVIRINIAQRSLGNTKAGIDALHDWLKQYPDDLRVRFALASTYMKDGQRDNAKSQFRLIIEKQPDNAFALNDLAWLLHESGEQGAVEMAEQAHRLAPDNAAIQDTYGWLLVQNGRVEQGLIALEQAAKNAPDIYDIRYHLAVALVKVGEKTRAKQELKSILEPDKPFTERGNAKVLLKELES